MVKNEEETEQDGREIPENKRCGTVGSSTHSSQAPCYLSHLIKGATVNIN